MNLSGNNFDDTIIILGFYLAVSYRLLPAINNIAVSNQQLKFGKPSHDKILEYYLLEKENIFFDKSKENVLDFNDNIKLENIFFSYKNENLFEGLNLRIDKNEIIGILGESGTGKSTLLNILVNLIKPQKGYIYLDDKLILDKFDVRKYQNLFSIVTQESFLINETILENIVIDKNNFDRKKLDKSLKFASLNETINSLENGLNTKVGMAKTKNCYSKSIL